MKMKPSIALFAASALLAGVAGAQEKAAEAPAADKPKQEKEITVSPEQMKKDLGYFLGFQSGQQLGSIPTLTFDDLDQESFLQGIKDGAAKHDTRQHADDKPVVFQKFHVISSLPMHLSGAGTMIARRAGVYVSYYMA